MTFTPKRILALASVCGVTVLASAPAASAAVYGASGTGFDAAGKPGYFQIAAYDTPTFNTAYGTAVFLPDGEILSGCDGRADGRSATAQLRNPANARVYSVKDPNGFDRGGGSNPAGKCGRLNLSFAEGTRLQLRVCIGGLGCTSWRTVSA